MEATKRLRVVIRNAKECRTILSFPDLQIIFSNDYKLPLTVKEGEEIPLDLLDQDDIKKSLRAGSLKGYMDNGWIAEIIENAAPVEEPTRLSHFITEQMILAPGMSAPLKPLAAVAHAAKEVPATPILPEVKKVEKPVVVSAPKAEAITDPSLVKSFEDFEKLSLSLKLRFIKDSTDIALLKDILGKTSSVQIKNNIQLRISQIKV
ncbi:MAG: hypothetical protein ACREBR_05800 [bacterium]